LLASLKVWNGDLVLNSVYGKLVTKERDKEIYDANFPFGWMKNMGYESEEDGQGEDGEEEEDGQIGDGEDEEDGWTKVEGY
jgi:hypothetical protein